ncbi:MAG: ribose-phosphate diphosphokinase [Chloroflexi bacterium]|nr:ribose-phosphate diphosphokinase [Chloroflexota bacterium]
MSKGTLIYGQLALVAGSGNPELAREISETLGVSLHKADITVFDNENIFVQLQQTVRSMDVFVLQPTCSPVNYNVMELLILLDTVRRASAGRITAVMPFFAYARSDKKDKPRVPITARLLADMVATAGADRFMTVDLHAGQIQGFFSIPGDELSAFPLLSEYFARKQIKDLVVVAADLGFAKKARNFAEWLKVPVAFVEKRREGPDTTCLSVIGDVQGKNVLIVDDEVDRGTTVTHAAESLRQAGARDVYLCFVHATFSDRAEVRLAEARFKEIVCTNSQPIRQAARDQLPNLRVIHLGDWLARIIDATHRGSSVGETLRAYEPKLNV